MSEAYSPGKAAAVEKYLSSNADGQEQTPITIGLTPFREKEVMLNMDQQQLLSFIAQGLDSSDIARILGLDIDRQTVSLEIRNIMFLLGVNTQTQAVVEAIKQHQLDLQSLVPPDFNPSAFESFNLAKRRSFLAFVANNDDLPDKHLAWSLGITSDKFSARMQTSLTDIGAVNRTQAMVFFLEARRQKQEKAIREGRNSHPVDVFGPSESENGILSPRENEILKLVAKGHANWEIALALGISKETVKRHMSSVLRRFGSEDRTQAVKLAIELGELDLSSLIPENFNISVMQSLIQREREIISVIADCEDTSYGRIAKILGISYQNVKNRMGSIFGMIGAANKTQAVVFFLEARRRKQEEARQRGGDPESADPFDWGRVTEVTNEEKALTSKKIEILILVGSGLSNVEIANKLGISKQTVKDHMTAIFRKTGVTNRAQAVVFFLEARRQKQEEAIIRNGEDPELVRLF